MTQELSDGQFQLCTHPPSSLVICRSEDFSRFHVLANGAVTAVSRICLTFRG